MVRPVHAQPGLGTAEGLDLLVGVSCRSAASCTAVGSSAAGGSSTTVTLGEAWNGTAWSIVTIPAPGRFASALAGVSCGSAACTAVGYFRDGSGTHRTLAEASGRGGWAIQPAPARLVPCPASWQGRVVRRADGLHRRRVLRQQPGHQPHPGGGMERDHVAHPADARSAGAAAQLHLASVSCSSASACMAVEEGQRSQGVKRHAGRVVERHHLDDPACPSAADHLR